MPTKILLLLLPLAPLCAGSARASALPAAPDTVKVISDPGRVTVTSGAGVSTVTVEQPGGGVYTYSSTLEATAEAQVADDDEAAPDDWTPGLPFVTPKTWRKVRTTCISDIYAGWLHPVDADPWLKSGWEMGISQLIGIEWRPCRRGPAFSTGIGMGMRTFLADNNTYYCKRGDVLAGVPYAEGEKRDYSRLVMFNFQVPLLISQRLAGDFGLQVGGVMNFNTYATATTQMYLPDGSRLKTEYKGLSQRFVTFDLVAAVGWLDNVGVYVRYSPMQPFRDGMGPRMHSLSVGATLGF